MIVLSGLSRHRGALRRCAGFLLSVLSLLLLGGCSFDEPVLPEWAVTVNVPLAQERFVIGEELINDSTIVAQGADSTLFITFDGNLDTLAVSAVDFNLGVIDTTQIFSVGVLDLSSIEVVNTGPVTMRQIYPELGAIAPDGGSISFTVPETTLAPPPTSLPSNDFCAIHVVSGSLGITFHNNLPFPLGPNSNDPQGVRFVITDSTGQQVVTIAVPEVIQPGETITRSAPLSSPDGWVHAPLQVDYVLPVAQETVFQLSSEALDTLSVSLATGLENVVADEAIARLEPQQFADTLAFALQTKHQLREVVLNAGAISLNFTNQTGMNTGLRVRIPSLLDPQGEAYSDTLHLVSGSSRNIVLDLADRRIAGLPGKFLDSLAVYYSATSDVAGGFLHVRATDHVAVDIVVDTLDLRSFSGVLNEEIFEIDPIEQNNLIDYQDVPEGLRLSEVNLSLTLQNELFIQNMKLDLQITGYHRDENGAISDSASLLLADQQIAPGHPGFPGTTVLSLSGNEVADFLNVLPTDIRTSGSVRASGEVEIGQNGRVFGSFNFSTPLKFAITEGASLFGDVEELTEADIDADMRDAAAENIEEALLALRLINHAPIGATLRLVVSADPTHTDLYDDTPLNSALEFAKELAIVAAPVDPETGFVTGALQNELSVQLSKEEALLFSNPPLRFGYELSIPATNGIVTVRASDYVSISGLATVVLRISE